MSCLFHVGGLNIFGTAFSIGAGVYLHAQFDPAAAIADLTRVQAMIVVPTLLQAMITHPDWAAADFSSVRTISIGSTDVASEPDKAVHAYKIPIFQIYGATETAPFAIYQQLEDAFDTVGSISALASPVRLHCVITRAAMLRLAKLARYVYAAIIFYLAIGKMHKDKAALRQGWFHTGDVARCDDNGLYYFMDHQICDYFRWREYLSS